ncbi:MAG: glycosyltransferase family 4 protein [Sphingorhabdus sp.]
MRVCFVSRRFFPAISGMSVYALNLLRQLVARGHDVTMISQYRGDDFGTRVYGGGPPPPVEGVHVIGLEQIGEQNGGDFELDVARMEEAILTEHARKPFDVLHAQYGYPNGWAVQRAAARIGVPTVVSIQGGDGHWVGSCCRTHYEALRRVLLSANALLIGGESFIGEVAERMDVPRNRFTIVPGAVDTTRFIPRVGRSPGDAVSPVRLLYHGRVDARKGVLDFLDALKILRNRNLRFAALISGIGPDVDSSQARSKELGLQDAVCFTGYANYADVPALYRDADIFVSPTYAEGFSNTILEAMAAGLPVISCRSVGVIDCLRDGENGLLTEPGDITELADGLARLITDRDLRAKLAATALEECRRTYSWEAVGGLIEASYYRVADQRPESDLGAEIPIDPACRFRAEPHLL